MRRRSLPEIFHECVVDTRNEAGHLEEVLEDLQISSFPPSLFANVRSGKVAAIDMDRDLVVPMLTIQLRDETHDVLTLAELLLDDDRMKWHKLYVPRLLHTMGLKKSADNSWDTASGFENP